MDQHSTHGTPDTDEEEADTASGGAPETPTTDDDGHPVDNPSGG